MARTWDSLNQEDKNEVVCKAFEWQQEHREHVQKLSGSVDAGYAPSGSDLLRPDLWKEAHWYWFVRGGECAIPSTN